MNKMYKTFVDGGTGNMSDHRTLQITTLNQ